MLRNTDTMSRGCAGLGGPGNLVRYFNISCVIAERYVKGLAPMENVDTIVARINGGIDEPADVRYSGDIR